MGTDNMKTSLPKTTDVDNFTEYARIFDQYHDDTETHDQGMTRAFKTVPKTGVIFATARATELGYTGCLDKEWANLGQGAPEVGPIPGAPKRDINLTLDNRYEEYGPPNGDFESRESVAAYYNEFYRKGKESQYTASNVCLVPGGRMGITRVMAVLGDVQVGYFRPDYTAYEQCLGLFVNIRPTALLHEDPNNPIMGPGEFRRQVEGLGLGATLMSNPCNPTGKFLEGEDLEEYVQIARDNRMALIMDEFYSHYMYNGKVGKTVSAASHVEDVDEDPLLIINGLTKNWRCPGWRLCWVVGPSKVISMVSAAGSYLDGGPNHPMQKLMSPLMDLDFIRKDIVALQNHFREKRDFMVQGLRAIGIKIKDIPESTFYIWADLSDLPPPLNDCLGFFEMCARNKVITVPGVFFDLNPNSLRDTTNSWSVSYVRFSYGPEIGELKRGLANIETAIDYWTNHQSEQAGEVLGFREVRPARRRSLFLKNPNEASKKVSMVASRDVSEEGTTEPAKASPYRDDKETPSEGTSAE